MALAPVSASLSVHIRGNVCVMSSAKSPAIAQLPQSNIATSGSLFTTGFPLVIRRTYQRKPPCRATSVSIRSEQRAQEGNSLDVWLGRLAMVGFAAAISVEIATGKGILENFGVTSPLPTVALAVTALVGVLTAVFIFQSASKN
ncbi:stress enhanced protein 1, chloroplastic [Quillaja saponaria]|uniref:Stress enhanced protein 1, chloroplastic n=1 Tax=Quillaja saponaria TaxID=32244 RepID=A0AAD7M2H1_QUISA|nr:stress enhanced protein 1, chloroplastic [Quillaja saponaria]